MRTCNQRCREDGFGEFYWFCSHRLVLGCKRVTGLCVDQFRHRDDVTSRRRLHESRFAAKHGGDLGEPLILSRSAAREMRFGLQRPGQDFEEADLSHIGIGKSFEHECEWLTVWILLDGHSLIADGDDCRRSVGGGWSELHDEVGESVDGDRPDRRTADDREHLASRNPVGHDVFEFLNRRYITVEVSLEQIVIPNNDPLDKSVMHFVLLVDKLLGHVCGLGATRIVYEGLIPEEVGNTVECLLLPDRQLDGCNSRTEPIAELGNCCFEGSSFLVKLVHENHPRRVELFSYPPCVLGLHLDTFDSVDDEDREIGDPERRVKLSCVVSVSRGIDHVDLVSAPLEGGQSHRDRCASLVFLGVIVGDRGARLDRSDTIDRASAEEKRLCKGGLSRSGVPHECNVADLFGREDFHRRTPWLDCYRVLVRV